MIKNQETWGELQGNVCYYRQSNKSKNQEKPINQVKLDKAEKSDIYFWIYSPREKCPNTDFFLVRIFLYLD